MATEIIIKYLHFVFIFIVVSTVVAEHLLLKPQLTKAELQRIARIDGLYGISSIFVVAAGLYLWLGEIGKPAAFYTENHLFLTKVGLFVIVGLLSIHPTIFFLKNQKGEDDTELVDIPKSIKIVLRIELLILFTMPLLATMMAKGIGLS
ncbi:MAG: putative membrane protein [Cognaticolwellia sp.]|jgi:putative membrane protein